MSIFGDIMHKIWTAADQLVAPAAASTTAPTPIGGTTVSATAPAATPDLAVLPATSTTAAPAPPVDVNAVLTKMAAAQGTPSNWQVSIVDLLHLLGLDYSLAARKQLAAELNIHVGADGTAEENTALRKAVMQKLADNGGVVPDSLKT